MSFMSVGEMGRACHGFNAQLKEHMNKYESIKSQEKIKYLLSLSSFLFYQGHVLSEDLV